MRLSLNDLPRQMREQVLARAEPAADSTLTTDRPAPKRDGARASHNPMVCHTCQQSFHYQTGAKGWETHADTNPGHTRFDLDLQGVC